MSKAKYKWDVDLTNMLDQFVSLETHDGIIREGKITRVEHKEIEVNGQKMRMPGAIELNNDMGDLIDFVLIRRMTLT